MPTGSVFIRLTYTPRSSSGNVANSQFGLFGGDFGLNENLKNKKNDVSIIMFESLLLLDWLEIKLCCIHSLTMNWVNFF